jgi:RimJ/RimL family protein N-acetyltransferase
MDSLAGEDTLPTLMAGSYQLRPLRAEDKHAIFAIFSNLEVTKFWGFSTFERLEQADTFIAATVAGFYERRLLEWGVVLEGEGTVIGTVALTDWSHEHRRAEIGYALERSWWGRGVMQVVLPELLRFGFGMLGLHRVEADVDPRNTASIRLLDRLGFKHEGYQRQRYLVNGEFQDAVLFGLLRDETSHEHTPGFSRGRTAVA